MRLWGAERIVILRVLKDFFVRMSSIGSSYQFDFKHSPSKRTKVMAYSHRLVSGIDIVDISDSMDLYSVPDLKKFCKNLTHKEGVKILLTLEKVHFLDSSGLGMLTNLYFECQQKGIPLKLARLSAEAKRLFVLTKLEQSIPIYETEEDAISRY